MVVVDNELARRDFVAALRAANKVRQRVRFSCFHASVIAINAQDGASARKIPKITSEKPCFSMPRHPSKNFQIRAITGAFACASAAFFFAGCHNTPPPDPMAEAAESGERPVAVS